MVQVPDTADHWRGTPLPLALLAKHGQEVVLTALATLAAMGSGLWFVMTRWPIGRGAPQNEHLVLFTIVATLVVVPTIVFKLLRTLARRRFLSKRVTLSR